MRLQRVEFSRSSSLLGEGSPFFFGQIESEPDSAYKFFAGRR